MTNEQLAQKYAKRVQRCIAAMKIFLICVLAMIAVLVIFVLIANGLNMKESNPLGFQWGMLIIAMPAVLCAMGAIITMIIANITMFRFKKLGADKS